jgi:hypothetical protein
MSLNMLQSRMEILYLPNKLIFVGLRTIRRVDGDRRIRDRGYEEVEQSERKSNDQATFSTPYNTLTSRSILVLSSSRRLRLPQFN